MDAAGNTSAPLAISSFQVLAPSASVSGGGGSADPNAPITTQEFKKSPDGTKTITDTIITKTNGVPTQAEMKSTITTVSSPTSNQTVYLDSSAVSNIKNVGITFGIDAIKEITTANNNNNIDVNIVAKEASYLQQSENARTGLLMIDGNIISVDIKINKKSITNFTEPITLTFDVSALANKNGLKAYWFNVATNKWELAGNGGVLNGNELILSINHLTDFALMSEKKETSPITIESAKPIKTKKQIELISAEAQIIFDSGNNHSQIIEYNNAIRNSSAESEAMNKYTEPMSKGFSELTTNQKYAINNFIVYGTITTIKLGIGERAGVINSFKAAFGKLPTTIENWKDILKISNGRWPSQRNSVAEDRAKIEFKKIYNRNADMKKVNDNAAITIMSYGLRNVTRNTDSEKTSIKIFKAIYKKTPSTANDWDLARAIAYSGAKR